MFPQRTGTTAAGAPAFRWQPAITARDRVLYLNRSDAEQNKRYQQLIPYVLILGGDRILRYRRGKAGQETRLHGLYSVGIGGHISEEDHGLFSNAFGYHDGMRRELMEEVAIDELNEAAVAVINDDSTEVGFVHFGIVHILRVASEEIVGRRSGIVSPEFVSIAEAVENPSGYESWSRLLPRTSRRAAGTSQKPRPRSAIARADVALFSDGPFRHARAAIPHRQPDGRTRFSVSGAVERVAIPVLEVTPIGKANFSLLSSIVKLKLMARKTESPDVTSFIFKPERPLVWKAGQFLHYVLNHEATDDRGSDRWFTIASAPYERHVMLTTRFASKQSSTFKKALKALKPGGVIEVSDLDGDFIVSDPKREYVFIAGGIGITPFRAILKEAAHTGKPLRATLLYANRDKVAAYKKELEAIARRNPNFKIHYLFSPQRIDKKTIQELVPDLKRPLFYVSGPEPMVESVGKMLQEIGVPKKRIKQDWFPGYPAY